jgi:parallel beta-helix repeat protein
VSEFSRVAPPHAGALVFALTALIAAPASAKTLAVGQDPQCPRAQFTSIQSAVDNARPGDTVNVCPGTYAEQVTVAKPLTLRAAGDPTAGACLTRTPADPSDQAIIAPGHAGFTVALRLVADGIRVRGLVIQGASVGLDTSDRFSGYRVEHNLIEDSALFAVDAGSAGAEPSRFDHNCLRDNGFGLVSELTDDSLWPQPPVGSVRAAYARNLRNARVDHNETTRNGAGVEAAGPGQPVDVSFDHNHSVQDGFGVAIQNSIASRIADNQILDANAPIFVGGANTDLRITGNLARGTGFSAITFTIPGFFVDDFPAPSRFAILNDNDVRSSGASGISFNPDTLEDSLVKNNTSSANGSFGITLGVGNTGNVIRDNEADDNPRSGIIVRAGATGNTLVGNSMHGNGAFDPLNFFDARDDNSPLNTWIRTDCDTDVPVGLICGR